MGSSLAQNCQIFPQALGRLWIHMALGQLHQCSPWVQACRGLCLCEICHHTFLGLLGY